MPRDACLGSTNLLKGSPSLGAFNREVILIRALIAPAKVDGSCSQWRSGQIARRGHLTVVTDDELRAASSPRTAVQRAPFALYAPAARTTTPT